MGTTSVRTVCRSCKMTLCMYDMMRSEIVKKATAPCVLVPAHLCSARWTLAKQQLQLRERCCHASIELVSFILSAAATSYMHMQYATTRGCARASNSCTPCLSSHPSHNTAATHS